jgi:acyl carrier protein
MSKPCKLARELLAQALTIDIAMVDEATCPGVTPQWDSLAHMNLALSIEKNIGRQLDPETILAIASLKDIENLLQS